MSHRFVAIGLLGLLVLTSVPALGQDYPNATWKPADSANFTVDNRPSSNSFNYIVVHVAEGSYQSTINWFQDPAAKASAHYVVSKTGDVTQMVLDKDIAWHAGNWEYNKHSLGIEHEGFTANASTWTEPMYQASAKLTRWLADTHGIALNHPTGIMPASATTQTGIIGHNQVPDPNDPTQGGGKNHHTDPGQYFNWTHYMDLVRGSTNFTVHLTSPGDNAWQRGTITAQGTTSQDGNLAYARFLVDGSVARWQTTAPHTWVVDTHNYTDGPHTMTFEAKNGTGVVASETIHFLVDNTVPRIALTDPKPGYLDAYGGEMPALFGLTIVVGDVPVTVSASDATSGVARVEYSVDGTLEGTVTASPFDWTWSSGGEWPGSHTLTATAFDKAGNSASSSLNVDLTVPFS